MPDPEPGLKKPFDLAVIGGGIVGLATAKAYLSRNPGQRIAVLEAESKFGSHQTGHNSGVVHAGLYYKPGSQKARDCVAGRERLERWLEGVDVPYRRCGKLVVASRESQRPALEELARRGAANGLEGIRRLEGLEALREIEPEVVGVAGLWVPHTGIVDYSAVAEAFAGELETAGVELFLNHRVRAIRQRPDGQTMVTEGGEVWARRLVNCAGLHSDRVAKLAGVRAGARILPFRGEYYCLKPEATDLVRGLIYPVPDPRFPFLGVHLTRMVDERVEAGPNAVLAWSREGYRKGAFRARDVVETLGSRAFWRLASRYWRTAIDEVRRSWSRKRFVAALQELVPAITPESVEAGGAGVRAQAVTPEGKLVDDFWIERGANSLHVLNAPSPAATASLSIGDRIATLLDQ